MATLGTQIIKIKVDINLWDAIKLRIAGIQMAEKVCKISMESQLESLGGLWKKK